MICALRVKKGIMWEELWNRISKLEYILWHHSTMWDKQGQMLANIKISSLASQDIFILKCRGWTNIIWCHESKSRRNNKLSQGIQSTWAIWQIPFCKSSQQITCSCYNFELKKLTKVPTAMEQRLLCCRTNFNYNRMWNQVKLFCLLQ